MKKHQLVNLGLIAGFFCCYTEWGQNRSMFIAGAMYEILFRQNNFWQNITHPLILAGFLGLLTLLYCLITPKARYSINITGVILLAIVVLLFLFVGILAKNGWIILSTVPFIVFAVLFFRWKSRRQEPLLG